MRCMTGLKGLTTILLLCGLSLPGMGQPSNNHFANAAAISDPVAYCSPPHAFYNDGATRDGVRPGDWPSGQNRNVWFKFQAVKNAVKVDLKTSGWQGIEYPMLALHDDQGNELVSHGRGSRHTLRTVIYSDLQAGSWYYINVDNDRGWRQAWKFSLCVDNYDSNDGRGGAFTIENAEDFCSTGGASFTTAMASPDGVRPENWQNGPNNNVWFRFQAVRNSATVAAKTGGSEGKLEYAMLSLETESGIVLANEGYASNYTDREVTFTNLTPGDWYYVNVDSRYINDAGELYE